MSLKSQLVNHPLGASIVIGAAIGVLCIIEALVSERTFGQRCAVPYQVNSPEWHGCVERLNIEQSMNGAAK